MSLCPSMQELIGNTPLVRLLQLEFPEQLNVYARLELYNPVDSVRDRIGRSVVVNAESYGILEPGSTIIEATAGNTELGIAFAALNRGYRLIFMVPQEFFQERQTLMKALGAEIIHTPTEEGMLGTARRAEELYTRIADPVSLKQFKNQSSPQAHYETAGPEIYRDLDGRIDYVVAGAGSDGTYTSVLQYLKEQGPAVEGVLADLIGSTIGGGEHSGYEIEDIGNDFVADTMGMSPAGQVTRINDVEVFEQVRIAAKKEGIFAGSSSGVASAAANKLIKITSSRTVVVTLPGRGKRYFSKHIFGE